MTGFGTFHFDRKPRHPSGTRDVVRCPHCFDPQRSHVQLERHLQHCPVLEEGE